tara:strand:- start:2878 stop:3054 length:177 start_codon:yes stop_codon:yes gene_type:complete
MFDYAKKEFKDTKAHATKLVSKLKNDPDVKLFAYATLGEMFVLGLVVLFTDIEDPFIN